MNETTREQDEAVRQRARIDASRSVLEAIRRLKERGEPVTKEAIIALVDEEIFPADVARARRDMESGQLFTDFNVKPL